MAVPRLFVLAGLLGLVTPSADAALPERLLVPEVERQFGTYVDAIVTSQFTVLEDPALTARVAAVVRRLVAASPRAEEPWTVQVLNTTMVNAFAGPGNYVYVTTGLLDLLEDESELAAVLGHEVVHVCAQHPFRGYQNSERAQGALSVIEVSSMLARLVASAAGVPVGYYADLSELAASLGTVIIYHRYSRAYETEADDLGFSYVVQAGYAPEGMASLFQKFLEYHKREMSRNAPILFSTHPHLKQRLRRAHRAAEHYRQRGTTP